MRRNNIRGPILTMACACALAGCTRAPRPYVDLTPAVQRQSRPYSRTLPALRIGVAPQWSPSASSSRYEALVEYLGRKLDERAELVLTASYREMLDILRQDGCDAAILPDYVYVKGRLRYGLNALVVPQTGGSTQTRAIVIASADNAAEDLDDLRGVRFAFTDPLSAAGRLAVQAWLEKRVGSRIHRFFGSHVYTYGADNAIAAVVAGRMDAAAVDESVYTDMLLRDASLSRKTKIVWESEPWHRAPFVASPGLADRRRGNLQHALLTMHQEIDGREILANLDVDRYVLPHDDGFAAVLALAGEVNWP